MQGKTIFLTSQFCLGLSVRLLVWKWEQNFGLQRESLGPEAKKITVITSKNSKHGMPLKIAKVRVCLFFFILGFSFLNNNLTPQFVGPGMTRL